VIWTLQNFPKATDKRILDVQASQELWKFDFESELRQKAVRLLQCRAGGRLSMFEAGMLYQICLTLGLEDSRHGKMLEQENYWNDVVLSCSGEDEAKIALESLLQNKRVETRSDRHKEFLLDNKIEEGKP
jgi:hypothetical protein